MCLLAGNLVIKALPNTEVGGTYTYYNNQSVHNVTQATKEDENDEPTIFVKEIVEMKVVNFSQGKHELTDDERALAEQIVACEAGADSLEGQMAVAQCLYDSAVLDGLTSRSLRSMVIIPYIIGRLRQRMSWLSLWCLTMVLKFQTNLSNGL